MGLCVGSVVFDDNGNIVTKDGMAAVYYDRIHEQESPSFPNPDVPPPTFTGTKASWASRVNASLLNVRRGFARQAMAMANALIGISAEGVTDGTPNTIDLLTFPTVANVMYVAELSILGVGQDNNATNRYSLITFGSFRGGNPVTNSDWMPQHDETTAGSSSFAVSGANIIARVTGQLLVPMKWRASLRLINAYLL